MQFDNVLRWVTGILVQPIEILRDNAQQHLPVLQFDQCSMGGIRSCSSHLGGEVAPRLPIPLASLGVVEKIMVANRWLPLPDRARAAKIGNARFCADACSSEGDNARGLLY